MGIGFGRKYKNCGTWDIDKNDPNPDPYNFRLVRILKIGDYKIVLANYPDCTTFGGDKILLFHKSAFNTNATKLDPHFCEGQWSPLARFKPNDEGFRMAKELATILSIEL